MHVKDEILARMYVLLTLLSVLPLLVAVQIVRVSVFEGSALRAQGERQASSQFNLPAMRGTIVDRAGRTLAVNTARYELAVDPTVDGYADRADAFFDRLARITGEPAASYRRRVATRTSRQYARLARSLDEASVHALGEVDLPGLIAQESFSRRYTYGRTAAHVLGHVDADLHGIAGIEMLYDQVLTGIDGRQAAQRDRRGVLRASLADAVVEPVHGETVVLTIDLVRQSVLEEELARGVNDSGARWGSAIAMDPWTGEILAMANYPTFDPNRAGTYSHDERRNHAITDQLEPGSTFKLVTAVAAVQEGVVSMEDSIDTGDGWTVIHGRTVNDTHALGKVTFRDVIAHSSNVGTAMVAENLEEETFYRYARALGFGHRTGIDLPGEVAGTLKEPSEWSGTTLTSMSRGYEVAATPIQMVRAYAALANGGTLVQPYVVAERRDVTGRVIWRARQDSMRSAFRASTARKLMPAFEQVLTDGSADAARVEGVRSAGKTGTARVARDGRYEQGAYRASFVGFYPVEEPRVVLFIVLDRPRNGYYGGYAAAPVFRETVRRWIATTRDAMESTLATPPDPDSVRVPTPDVTSMPVVLASSRIRAAGLRPRGDDTGDRHVASQRPGPDEVMEPGDGVRLETAPPSDDTAMPDLRGLTVREATWWLGTLGVTPRVEGSGIVRSQSPAPGSALGSRAVLRCR